MTFRVLDTNHTSFTVSNLDRTVAFWRDCPGFELVSKAPGHTIELIEYRAPVAAPVTIEQGPNKGRKVVYVRDWDGVTIEFIKVPTR